MTESITEYGISENKPVNHPKEAIKVLKSYLIGWKNNDWKRMLKNSTATFKGFNKEDFFQQWFDKNKLLSFDINQIAGEEAIPAVADIEVTVTIKRDEEEISKTYTLRMIKEREAYMPSVNGRWGVNPPSSLKVFNNDVPIITVTN